MTSQPPALANRASFVATIAALACLSFFLTATALSGAEAGKKSFDIPAGTALDTLKQFTTQSGGQLLYSAEAVEGVRTSAVKGQLTPVEALNQMFAGTALTVVQDRKDGGLTVRRETAEEKKGVRAAPSTASDRPTRDQMPVALPEQPEETVKLSPFIIESTLDEGYVASSTLAGSRLKTPLKDVAAQISVFTPEIMEDLALAHLDEVYLYSSNVESYLEFAPTGADAVNFGSVLVRTNTRIRGLGDISLLRNFFQTAFEGDPYNSERVTIASGPNSILFGLGRPGGASDLSTKQAQTNRSFRTASYRTDNNRSHRSSLDINQVLWKDKVAFRLNGLRDHRESFREPSTDSSQRLAAAVTIRPTKDITLRFNKEWLDRGLSRPMMTVQFDYLTPWWDAGKPMFNNQGITPTSAASVTTGRIPASLGNVLARNTSTAGLIIMGNSPELPISQWAGTVSTKNPGDAAGLSPEDSFAYSMDRPALWDPNVNGYGSGIKTEIGGSTLNAFAEYRPAKKFAVEFGYMYERAHESRGGFKSSALFADPNQFLPDGATPNPNFGKLYLEGSSTDGAMNLEDKEEKRLTFSYDLDFRSDAGWRHWLGRHQIAALLSDADDWDLRTTGYRAAIMGSPNFLPTAAQTDLRHASRQLIRRQYIYLPGQGDNFGKVPFNRDVFEKAPMQLKDSSGTPYEIVWFDDPRGQQNAASGRKRNILSRTFVVRDYFLQDRLTTFFGWREDRVRLAGIEDQQVQTSRLPDGRVQSGLFPYWRTAARYLGYDTWDKGHSTNYGVTAFPLRWLSVHYNYSENFAITSGATQTPYGVFIPGSGGEGKDYGFSLNLLDGKFAFRFNLFQNDQRNIRPNNAIALPISSTPLDIEFAMQTVIAPGLPKLGVDYDRYEKADYQTVADTNGKGADVELVANVNENWRLFLTLGRQKTTFDIRDVWWRWVEERLPTWQKAGKGWDAEYLAGSATKTIHQAYTDWATGARDSFIAQSGRLSDRQREWRANLNANYRFTTGRLKGLAVGGGGRWRSAAVLGYPILAGTQGVDLRKPYMGDSDLFVDANTSYTFRRVQILGDATRWRVQLNVRNLLSNGGLVVSKVKTDGSPGLYSFRSPREFIFTVTTDF